MPVPRAGGWGGRAESRKVSPTLSAYKGAGGERPRRNPWIAVGKGFFSCTEQDVILHEIRSPDMSGKDNFALSSEMKEKVLRLFPFCMGDLSDLLP